MVCLPWIVWVCTLTADVANNGVISDLLSRLAVSARVEDFLLSVALSDLLVSPVIGTLVSLATILSSGKSAANNAGSHERHG